MAIIEGGASPNALVSVGAEAFSPMHSSIRPISHGALGHYRVTHRTALVATQAANSRLFQLRNTHASQLVVLTRLRIQWLQTGAHTAAIEDSLDFFRCTNFTAVDTTNIVTPATFSVKRGGMAAAASSIAAVRGCTTAGAAAGMTGGTLTKEGIPGWQLAQFLLATQPTAGTVIPIIGELNEAMDGSHPYVFGQNEGFEIENRVLLGAAAGSSLYFDCSWVEVTAY